MSRQETLEAIRNQPNISVLIVGGGVNGIGTFRDLAVQGIDVLLVEKNDYSSGASAASSHMAHGGLRYLENGEFRLVQEALTERNRLLLNAPHYVHPLPTTIPIFKWFSGTLNAPLKFIGMNRPPAERGAFIIKAGLTMYDTFASTQRSMPTHEFMGRSRSLQRFPGLNTEVSVTATYYDAWMPYPERICLELVMDAEESNPNAHALNYMSAISGDGDEVTLQDELTGETYTVKPQIVINAAGPWIDFTNRAMQQNTNFIGGTKGSHLVVEHDELHKTLDGHEIFFENEDGRIVLIFPLEDRVLMGTTDIRIDDPDDAVCSEEEIEYILSLVEKVFPKMQVTRENVVFTFSGVRPLPAMDANSTGQISRDHSIRETKPGNGINFPIYSLIGGKWTTFRAFGEQAADKVLGELNVPRKQSTANLSFGGGVDYPQGKRDTRQWISVKAHHSGVSEERMATLFKRYGTRAEAFGKFIGQEEDTPLEHKPDYSQREIIYILRTEQMHTILDFVLRRSLLAMLGKLNRPLINEIAEVMAGELGWSAEEKQRQIDTTIEHLRVKNVTDVAGERSKLIGAENRSEPEATPDPAAEENTEPEPAGD